MADAGRKFKSIGKKEEFNKCGCKAPEAGHKWLEENIVCMCVCACECLCECTQEQCTYVDRCREYTNHCKRVRKAMREDKKKWLNEMMKKMEEDMRQY